MFLEIITPDKQVYSGEILSTTLPGTNGSFQVLKNHAPLISTLEKGSIVIKNSTEEKTFQIEGGIVEVLNNKVVVLAESIL